MRDIKKLLKSGAPALILSMLAAPVAHAAATGGNNDGFPWGLLGLAGLAGLAGLNRNNRR